MGFKKGNTFGRETKRGRAKKTIVKESLQRLNDLGITPLETSKELIDSLLKDTDITNKEKIQLLGLFQGLFKYELLTRAEELKLTELETDNEKLEETNQKLEDFIMADSPQELLKILNGENKNEK